MDRYSLFNELCTEISCFDCPLGDREGCHILFTEEFFDNEQLEVLKEMIRQLPLKEDK